jgi:hypothetical protein
MALRKVVDEQGIELEGARVGFLEGGLGGTVF